MIYKEGTASRVGCATTVKYPPGTTDSSHLAGTHHGSATLRRFTEDTIEPRPRRGHRQAVRRPEIAQGIRRPLLHSAHEEAPRAGRVADRHRLQPGSAAGETPGLRGG